MSAVLDDVTDYPPPNGVPMNLLGIIRELYIVTKERGIVRFGDVMNYAQHDLIVDCERQLAETGSIRAIVLKARQVGISTAIEAVIFVLSTFLERFQSLIVSHEKDSAQHILSMTRNYWDTYVFKPMLKERFNARGQLAWTTGSSIQVVTAKNLSGGRSRTIQALHASEAAFYYDPDSLMTGLRQTIPNVGVTAIFIESTGNGIGNWFHTTWVEAVKGANEFTPHFFPWHKHPEYVASVQDRVKYRLESLDEEERKLRTMGVDDQHLIWRRYAITNLMPKTKTKKALSNLDKFHQEYPTTPHEAFLSTGRNVFHLPDLIDHYRPERGRRGRLYMHGQEVRFQEHSDGWLTVFRWPAKDREWGGYMLIGADPTHTVAGDYACAHVVNRRTTEQVAVYRRHTDPIQFGKDLWMLGLYYRQAVIAAEKTGPGYSTVGYLVGHDYPNVWESQQMTKTPGMPQNTFGWGTNIATKHVAIQALVHHVSQPLEHVGKVVYGLQVHDRDTFEEMRDYVTTEDGQGYENGDGSEFDDGVMALAIAMAVHDWETPPPHYAGESKPIKPVVPVAKKRHLTAHVTDTQAWTEDDAASTEAVADDRGPVEAATEEAPFERWDDDDYRPEDD